MKWGFINVALFLLSQGWGGSGKIYQLSRGLWNHTGLCVQIPAQLRTVTWLWAGASRCLALPGSQGCCQGPWMCTQSLAPGGLLGNVPFCPVLLP